MGTRHGPLRSLHLPYGVVSVTLGAVLLTAVPCVVAIVASSGCAMLGRGPGAPTTPLAEVPDESVGPHVLNPVFIDSDPLRVEATLPLHNPRDQRVVVTTLETSCGCVSADLESRDIAPLGETKLTLALNMAGRLGRHRVTCRLFDDAGLFQECQVVTNGYRAIGFEQDDILLAIDPNVDSTLRLLTYARGEKTLPALKSVSCDDGTLLCEADKEPLIQVDENGIVVATYSVRLRSALEAPAGTVTSYLTAVAQTGETEHSARTCVRWNARSQFEVEPRLVFFPDRGKDRRCAGAYSEMLRERPSNHCDCRRCAYRVADRLYRRAGRAARYTFREDPFDDR
jgi:hypothetical protein